MFISEVCPAEDTVLGKRKPQNNEMIPQCVLMCGVMRASCGEGIMWCNEGIMWCNEGIMWCNEGIMW